MTDNKECNEIIELMLIECRGIRDEVGRLSAIRTLQELQRRINS